MPIPELQTVVGISLLIMLHEAGHFLVARACGMRVLRFSVGFGPALLKKRIGATIYQLAAIPLGGFVQIHGLGPAQPGDGGDPLTDAESYVNKPIWQRMAVIFAGPGANWFLAFLFLFLALISGTARPDGSPTIGDVQAESAAARAGLQNGDRILAIDGATVASWEELVGHIQTGADKELTLSVQRGTETLSLTARPERDGKIGRLGVAPALVTQQLGVLEAIPAAATATVRLTADYAGLLVNLVIGRGGGRLAGVVGVFKMVVAQARTGLGDLFGSLGWLSIGLALLNLVPLPALDGGRLGFLLAEVIRGRRLDDRLEGMIHAAGFLALLGLLIFASVRDLL